MGLYCALFWIQGKTSAGVQWIPGKLYCALFWIQGKTTKLRLSLAARLYCALFWIQGKTEAQRLGFVINCTVPYFGFKAKRVQWIPGVV